MKFICELESSIKISNIKMTQINPEPTAKLYTKDFWFGEYSQEGLR